MDGLSSGGVMRWIFGLFVAALLGVASAAQAEESGWTVIFRADDPGLWWRDAGDVNAANGYATKNVPANVQFLRLRRIDSKAAIIVPMRNELLNKSQPLVGSEDV